MTIQVALHHKTTYAFDRLVGLSPHEIRLRPASHCRTPIDSYSLQVKPSKHFLNWQQDPYGNYLARLVFPEPVREFRIEIDLVAEMSVFNPFDFFLEPCAEKWPFAYAEEEARELAPFLVCKPGGECFKRYLAAVDRKPRRTIDLLVGLNQRAAAA